MTAATDEFDVAIVGMSGCFPGARNLEEFWHNLAEGVESITRLSDEEILASGVPAAYLRNPNYVKASPVLDKPGHFAAAFFGFSPAEARVLDPQHRLLLELAHEALENAGCDPARHPGRIGVFAGSALNTYFTNVGLNERLADDYIPTLISNDKDFLSTRVSYKLNLKGPSVTVQTACSTSLVAIHLARQSLLSGETDMALVGAISVRVPHQAGYVCDGGGIVSPDGRVRAFDAQANGTVFGSGGGVLALKRLADAIADGDTIRAVIKGSAVNNDGQEKAGYSAPSVNGQADAVAEALANAGVSADSISYVEAHGSGTPVGDPIEVMALTKAFRIETQRSGYCAIGSVKTNVGHLDAAAGLAGIVKTVLALEHRQLPPSLHFTAGNPEIDFPSTPFYVNTALREWASDGPRRAGVMSTGMGGTNAHLVLEEAPLQSASTEARPPHLLVLSAKTETALDEATRNLGEFLSRSDAAVNLGDVAYTLQMGRTAHRHRRVLACAGRVDAVAVLGDVGSKRIRSGQADGAKRPVVLLLPGIGDHYVGMGHDLYETQPVFREAVDGCARLLEPHVGVDIRTILYPSSRSWKKKGAGKGIDLKKMLGNRGDQPADPDAATLNQTLYAQPALFTVEYAMARLWGSLGIVPDAIVCHSMGEYVAACLAGVLSLDDAVRLIAVRAKLVNELPQGAMLAVMLPERELVPLLGERLSISLINGPSLCVVAGPVDDVAEFERMLAARGIIGRHVQNAHAFHSRMLDAIVEPFRTEVGKVRLNEPRIPFTSNVSGTWITPREAMDPAYWGKHANHTARFSDALQALWQLTDPMLLEAGPGRTLGVLAMQHPGRAQAGNPIVVASIRPHYENESDTTVLLQNVGQLWLAGADIRWEGLYAGERRRRVPLPPYPFEREEYWAPPRASRQAQASAPEGRSVPQAAVEDWFYTPAWARVPAPGEAGASPVDVGSRWLVFADRTNGGEAFRDRLSGAGANVSFVRFGGSYRCADDGLWEIRVSEPDDYLRLFREIKEKLTGALNIVHLGCLGDRGESAALAANDKHAYGFFSLLHIAQAVGELGIATPVRIGVVSGGLHEVTGDETLDPTMATVLGTVGVIPKEFANVTCFNLDLAAPQAAADLPGEVIRNILSEFARPDLNDILAYRGRHRWKKGYAPIRLSAPPVEAEGTDRLRHGGVYLITGGTGGLGLAFSRYLAETYRAKLVLTRKSAFPERSRWRDIAESDDPADAIVKTVRELLAIESLGAEVEVMTAEVSDPAQMRRVIDHAVGRFHAINGVIHAAGIVRAGLIQAKTAEVATSVLAPKVDGARVLFDLVKDRELDFMVLFSSLSSVTVPYAHCDYSAANAFLDVFADYASAKARFRTASISWPVWKEVGVVAQLEALLGVEALKEQALESAMLTKDGLEAFGRILRSNLQHVVVSQQDLGETIERARSVLDPSRALFGTPPVAKASRPAGPQNPGRPETETEAAVADIWKNVFGYDQVGVDEPFATLGGHSLMAMQIVARIRALYHIDFSLREFFAAPTIAGLSAEIEAKILREIEALSDDQARRLVETASGDDPVA